MGRPHIIDAEMLRRSKHEPRPLANPQLALALKRRVRPEFVRLSRSQGIRMAEALQLIVAGCGTCEKAAERLGVGPHTVGLLLRREAAPRIKRTELEVLAKKLGFDITKWDVSED